MRASNTTKSALLAPIHSHHYGSKLKVSIETDFEVVGGSNRL